MINIIPHDFTNSHKNSISDIVCNGAQYLLFKRNIDSSNKICEIFSDYKEIILEDVEEKIDFYRKHTHPLEYGLRKKIFNLFIVFGNGNDLKQEEQFMNMAAAFSYLNEPNKNILKTNGLNSWCDSTLAQGDYSLFSVYFDEFMNRSNVNEEAKKDLQAIKLMRELQKDLPKKEEIADKKLKI